MHYFIHVVVVIQTINTKVSATSLEDGVYFMDRSDNDPETDLVVILNNKSYVPNEQDLPPPTSFKNKDGDMNYILSKLSDEDLVKLLNNNPQKNEYKINDMLKVLIQPTNKNNRISHTVENDENETGYKIASNAPYFKLDNKKVDPYNTNQNQNPIHVIKNKINNILYSHPYDKSENGELLFDTLVAQLKTLCCGKSKKSSSKWSNVDQVKSEFKKETIYGSPQSTVLRHQNTEQIFLVVNDDVRSNGSDLVFVNPDSLDKNSNVLLLGPIQTPLTDNQLKFVVNRITNEISQPEYLPLLKRLSSGTLKDYNVKLMKHFITGPETRRYIKPHRCNHQSKLAKIYGGPKWIICTGYLNLNEPSVYD